MTSMGSLSLQASQEVPVLRHEIQLVGETSTPSRGKGQGHRRQGPPLVLRLRARLMASALRVGPLPPFLGVFKSTFTHCSLSVTLSTDLHLWAKSGKWVQWFGLI